MAQFTSAFRPHLLSVLRIVTGFLFIQHGGQKLLGYPVPMRSDFDLFTLSGIAGSLELIGGALIIIGLFTRPTAFLLSGLMAFAYFIAHAPHGFWPIANKGELAALYCFVFLYFSVAGGGTWSLDSLRKGGR